MSRFNRIMKRLFSVRSVISLLAATLLISSFTLAITFLNRDGKTTERSKVTPQLVLWAWERSTDLRFIDANKFAVAFLAKSILLRSDDAIIRPRLQPLELSEGTKVIAVVRIEVDREKKASLSANQKEVTAREIVDMTSLPNVSEIQIDFDATQSQRDFYRELIVDIRRRLPSNIRLSITALASWCMYDNWLSDLPIDEAVPMLFRMSADGKQIASRLDAGDDFNAQPCRHSYGISMDEPHPNLFPSRRVFVFNPDAWTANAVRQVSESNK